MRAGLHSAVLLEVAPGASVLQATHALLLRGQLAALPPGRQAGAAAPAVLPWPAPGVPGQASGEREPQQLWWAGPEGALLLLWLTPEGREPPGVAEAAAAARAAAAAEQAALRCGVDTQFQSATGSGSGSSARRLMPWQHPFVRRRPAQ